MELTAANVAKTLIVNRIFERLFYFGRMSFVAFPST